MKPWTEEEIVLLKERYNKSPNSDLAKLFPERTMKSIYKKANKIGLKKTSEMEFQNRSESKKREKSSNWNGGFRNTSKGYRQVLCPNHPRSESSGYVMEHILVWEKETGVPVPENCCIHHLNGDKSDNRIENLCMMASGAHSSFHNSRRKMSNETKKIISQKAKERYADKKNHPSYKEVDVFQMRSMREQGFTVTSICEKFGISKKTYYCKMEEMKNGIE